VFRQVLLQCVSMRGRQHNLSSSAEGVAETDPAGSSVSSSSKASSRISSTNKTEYSPIRSPGIVVVQPATGAGPKSAMSTPATSSRATASSSRSSPNVAGQNRNNKVTSLASPSPSSSGGPGVNVIKLFLPSSPTRRQKICQSFTVGKFFMRVKICW